MKKYIKRLSIYLCIMIVFNCSLEAILAKNIVWMFYPMVMILYTYASVKTDFTPARYNPKVVILLVFIASVFLTGCENDFVYVKYVAIVEVALGIIVLGVCHIVFDRDSGKNIKKLRLQKSRKTRTIK